MNPIDTALAAGMLKDMIEHVCTVILGRDFVGAVERVGDGATSVAAGDEMFGAVPPMGAQIGAGA